MTIYKKGDWVDIHQCKELIVSNIKSFHVPCGFWDGYLEKRANRWYLLACEVDKSPDEYRPVTTVEIDPDEVRDMRIHVKAVRDEHLVESRAANCENGNPYDDACDKCATEGLAGDRNHRHCFEPAVPTVPPYATNYSYVINPLCKGVTEYIFKFTTSDLSVLTQVRDILDKQREEERQRSLGSLERWLDKERRNFNDWMKGEG